MTYKTTRQNEITQGRTVDTEEKKIKGQVLWANFNMSGRSGRTFSKYEKEQPRLWEVCWEQRESKNRRRGTGEHIDNSFVKFCYKGARRKGVVSLIGRGPRGVCFEDERNNCML